MGSNWQLRAVDTRRVGGQRPVARGAADDRDDAASGDGEPSGRAQHAFEQPTQAPPGLGGAFQQRAQHVHGPTTTSAHRRPPPARSYQVFCTASSTARSANLSSTAFRRSLATNGVPRSSSARITAARPGIPRPCVPPPCGSSAARRGPAPPARTPSRPQPCAPCPPAAERPASRPSPPPTPPADGTPSPCSSRSSRCPATCREPRSAGCLALVAENRRPAAERQDRAPRPEPLDLRSQPPPAVSPWLSLDRAG